MDSRDEFNKWFEENVAINEKGHHFPISKFDLIITGDNFIKNKIARLKTELEDLVNKDDKGGCTVDEILIRLWKWMGSRVDKKETTVREFYKMVKMFSTEMKAREKQTTNGSN